MVLSLRSPTWAVSLIPLHRYGRSQLSVFILGFLNAEERKWGEGGNPSIGVQAGVQIPVPPVMVTSSMTFSTFLKLFEPQYPYRYDVENNIYALSLL